MGPPTFPVTDAPTGVRILTADDPNDSQQASATINTEHDDLCLIWIGLYKYKRVVENKGENCVRRRSSVWPRKKKLGGAILFGGGAEWADTIWQNNDAAPGDDFSSASNLAIRGLHEVKSFTHTCTKLTGESEPPARFASSYPAPADRRNIEQSLVLAPHGCRKLAGFPTAVSSCDFAKQGWG